MIYRPEMVCFKHIGREMFCWCGVVTLNQMRHKIEELFGLFATVSLVHRYAHSPFAIQITSIWHFLVPRALLHPCYFSFLWSPWTSTHRFTLPVCSDDIHHKSLSHKFGL